MDLDAYFARIGYGGPRAPTLAVLRDLAALHPQTIGFENIAVAAGRVPDITLDAIEAKLVHGGRGGYCYEHNTLLQAVLTALGFKVSSLGARVRYQLPADFVMSRGHMVLRVDLPDGPFLVDAGFGGLTLTAPIALRWQDVQATSHEAVRFVPADDEFRLQARFGDDWGDVYQFDLSRQLPADWEAQNWFTATRPGALFATNVIATRPVPGGRWSLFNQTLTWRPLGGAPEKHAVVGAASLAKVVAEVFALRIPSEEIAAAAEVASRAGGMDREQFLRNGGNAAPREPF